METYHNHTYKLGVKYCFQIDNCKRDEGAELWS